MGLTVDHGTGQRVHSRRVTRLGDDAVFRQITLESSLGSADW